MIFDADILGYFMDGEGNADSVRDLGTNASGGGNEPPLWIAEVRGHVASAAGDVLGAEQVREEEVAGRLADR